MKYNLKKTYTIPQPTEKTFKELYKWGVDNLYPQWLNWLFYTSAVHQGIVNGKVFYTVSGGLINVSGGTEADVLVKKFDKINPDISRANEISNSFYLEMKFDLLKKSIIIDSIKSIPFEHVRATTTPGVFQISKNWGSKDSETKTLRSYNDVKSSQDKTELTFIYAHQRQGLQFLVGGEGRTTSDNKYPVVPYSGAINSILTDIEIGDYQLSEVVNNFSLGTVLSLNNGKPKDKKDELAILNRISDETTGAENAGGVFTVFANGKDTEPTVLHLNGNQLNERYLSLGTDVRKNIMMGHSAVSGELFGFASEGSFNSSSIEWAYFIMKNNYFAYRQTEILDAVNFVKEKNNITGTIEFNDIELPTQKEAPAARFKTENTKKTEGDATNEMIEAFSKIGIEKGDTKMLMSEPLDLINAFGGVFEGRENFATPSAIEIQVLNLMVDGESFDQISKALDIKPSDLAKLFQKLRRGGRVDENGQLTESGKIESIRSQVAKLKIMYSYEVKLNAPPLSKGGTSRDFCRTLIGFNRLYTREEITSIGNDLNTNVWMYRGGWYHNPETDKNEPSCRHFWQQHVTYLK